MDTSWSKSKDEVITAVDALNKHFAEQNLRFNVVREGELACTSPGNTPWGPEFVKECEQVISEQIGREMSFD